METEEFQLACRRTAPTFEQDLTAEKRIARLSILLHAQLGISSEAGELADAIKKHVIYGKQLDIENIAEELGDLLWYISLASDIIDISMRSIMERNVDKLKIRYPSQFTEKDAVERKDKI